MSCAMRVLVIFCFVFVGTHADYWTERQQFIKYEESMTLGARIVLNSKEQILNKCLMDAKLAEMDAGFTNPSEFAPAKNFFQAKDSIEKSIVFGIIRKMPKGGALHVHDTSISSTDYVLYNITYRDGLYACVTDDAITEFRFANSTPDGECWQSVKQMRQDAESDEDFDSWLRPMLTLETDDPDEKYPDIDVVWQKFSEIFILITTMITYRPVFQDYFYNALTEFYNDNVNYMEVRGTLPTVYELNGTAYDSVQVMGLLKEVSDQFLKDYPDFLGIKYVYAPRRQVSNHTMDTYIQVLKQLQKLYPTYLAGFDLVGQEDLGVPLIGFINQLQEVAKDVKFFFHAGETDWNGMSTDMNVIDAILLNSTRIGHGYALVKHPVALKEVKRRNIGIEVNPISNQVLTLVKDLRNHPAAILLSQDYPVIISADDPGLWGAKGLSYDIYEAFMGLARRNADLRMLKQLGYNSLYYSAMSNEDKVEAVSKWEVEWDNFVDSMSATCNHFAIYQIY